MVDLRRTLTPELFWQKWVLAIGGLSGRLRRERLELLPGMLVVIDAPRDGHGWRIRVGTGARRGVGKGDDDIRVL